MNLAQNKGEGKRRVRLQVRDTMICEEDLKRGGGEEEE
jgi:hypothetical protein